MINALLTPFDDKAKTYTIVLIECLGRLKKLSKLMLRIQKFKEPEKASKNVKIWAN